MPYLPVPASFYQAARAPSISSIAVPTLPRTQDVLTPPSQLRLSSASPHLPTLERHPSAPSPSRPLPAPTCPPLGYTPSAPPYPAVTWSPPIAPPSSFASCPRTHNLTGLTPLSATSSSSAPSSSRMAPLAVPPHRSTTR